MARNQPEDFDHDESGYRESGSHSGAGAPSPAMYSTSSPSSPAERGSLGANGLSSADMDLQGMGETALSGDASIGSSPYQGIEAPRPSPAQEAARASQKTATKSRGSSDPSPISMAKKRGNQPR